MTSNYICIFISLSIKSKIVKSDKSVSHATSAKCHQNLAVTKIVATIKWRLTTSTKLSFILDGKKFMPIHEALCATIWNIWYFLVTKEFFEDKRRMTQKNYNLLRIQRILYCIKQSRCCPKDINTFQNVSLSWHSLYYSGNPRCKTTFWPYLRRSWRSSIMTHHYRSIFIIKI